MGDSAASGGSFAGEEVVAFGLGIRLEGGEMGASQRHLSHLHFDFSKCEASVESNQGRGDLGLTFKPFEGNWVMRQFAGQKFQSNTSFQVYEAEDIR
jgi:hypothetical protein